MAESAPRERMETEVFYAQRAPYERLEIVEVSYSRWVVSAVIHGDLETRTGSWRHRVRGGDVMIHPPHIPFDEVAAVPGMHEFVEFDLRMEGRYDLLAAASIPLVFALPDLDAYRKHFQNLLDALDAPTTPAETTLALLSLVLDVIRQGKMVHPEATTPTTFTEAKRFDGIISYMHRHLAEPLDRERLAHRAGLHPAYFDRAFHLLYGERPMSMLRSIRLQEAMRRLTTTDETLETVAERCGLANAAYLSRVFRARYGSAPGAYRKSLSKTKPGYAAAFANPAPDA